MVVDSHNRAEECYKHKFIVFDKRRIIRSAVMDPGSLEARPFTGRGKLRIFTRELELPRLRSSPTGVGTELEAVS